MEFFDNNENFNKKMIKFKNEIEKLFHFHFGFFPIEDLPYSFKANSAPIDIYTDKNKLTIEIELPGISRNNILIAVHNNILAIRWKSEPKIKSTVNFFCIERRFGRFERFVLLPVTPSKQNIRAVLSDGVLSIYFEIGDIFINSETLIPIL
ncbi:MAG: Hsp20/alpha crystallin family protein [bacterium]